MFGKLSRIVVVGALLLVACGASWNPARPPQEAPAANLPEGSYVEGQAEIGGVEHVVVRRCAGARTAPERDCPDIEVRRARADGTRWDTLDAPDGLFGPRINGVHALDATRLAIDVSGAAADRTLVVLDVTNDSWGRISGPLASGLGVAAPAAAAGQAVPASAGQSGQASTMDAAVSYFTWNMGGMNPQYGANPAQRRSNADLAVFMAAAHGPVGIALQEVCVSVSGVPDAMDRLEDELGARGYASYWEWTGKSSPADQQNCMQGNAVFAPGPILGFQAVDLTFDGDERRIVACLKTMAFLRATTCSTHLGTVEDARRDQSWDVRRFATEWGSRHTWVGGDFNDDPESVAMMHWYETPAYWSEADLFARQPTRNGVKIDYGFGAPAAVSSEPGAAVVGEDVFSDHALLWAPHTWQG